MDNLMGIVRDWQNQHCKGMIKQTCKWIIMGIVRDPQNGHCKGRTKQANCKGWVTEDTTAQNVKTN